MSALEGPLGVRTKAALFAGCDIALHCNGKMDEMIEVAREVKVLAGAARDRADRALAQLHTPAALDIGAAEARMREMLAGAIA
jgi:beta-N-acetylhexosaminidase